MVKYKTKLKNFLVLLVRILFLVLLMVHVTAF
jgi:hypothetical protein